MRFTAAFRTTPAGGPGLRGQQGLASGADQLKGGAEELKSGHSSALRRHHRFAGWVFRLGGRRSKLKDAAAGGYRGMKAI